MPPAKPAFKKLTSWSYSRYHDYVVCPLKFKLKHLMKIAEPPNEAMARGSAIGKMVENYLNGKNVKLDPASEKHRADFKKALKLFKKDLEEGRKNVAKRTVTTVVEDNWAMTRQWLQTKWDDWANCWVRVKLDFAFVIDGPKTKLYINDWKTGKFRPDQVADYVEQIELYALAGLLLMSHVQEVYPSLKYLDLGRTYPDPAQGEEVLRYTRADIPKLIKTWEARVKPMFNDTKFAPKPHFLCSYCHYRKSNAVPGPTVGKKTQPGGGGQCKFG